MKETPSTCPYCGVGCGVLIASEADRITGVRGDPQHPANKGKLCSKGATLHLSAGNAGRALYPMMRRDRDLPRQRVSWDQALDHTAEKFAQIIQNDGPDSVAFYISGQLLTEDYYVFNKLSKGLIGTNNIDSNSRLCMSSAVAGYKASLGADAPPACYEDIDLTQCLFIAGSNIAYAHPVLYRRIEAARVSNPTLKTIVVDPRRTETAREADLHLAILPGTDIALFNCMLHVMVWEQLIDESFIANHCENFEAIKTSVAEYTPAMGAQLCGVSAIDIVRAARLFAQSKSTLSLYCQGLNQSVHGTHNNCALINLHLATGHIGKPGSGPLSLTGQPNAMGGREVGGMANLLSGHRDMANPEHRQEVARLWGVSQVPQFPGKTAVEIFKGLHEGSIKAVWIACTNPAQSMPDLKRVHEALRKAQWVVLQEAFAQTETAAFADVLLPATTWGEKEGTVTNSERCISRVRSAISAPGQARADWKIARDFALCLGEKMGIKQTPQLFAYPHAKDVFNEHRESTRGRDLDITGLSYSVLESRGPQQWPFAYGAKSGTARLYVSGRFPTPSGRARFVNTLHKPVAELTDSRFPLHLNTGRLRDQWHGLSRSGRVARLHNHAEEPVLSMNQQDMQQRQLLDNDIVTVSSRRAFLAVKVLGSQDLRPGQTFLPMHWGANSMSAEGVNALTVDQFDPFSKQPELKHAAIQVAKLSLPFHVVIMSRFSSEDQAGAIEFSNRAKILLSHFDYAHLGMAGNQDSVVRFRGFSAKPIDESVLRLIEDLLAMTDESLMRYVDVRKGVEKKAQVKEGRVQSICLIGETAAQDWLKTMMIEGVAVEATRPWILAPVSTPPQGSFNRGRVICACHDVSETQIIEQRHEGLDLAAIQNKLKCGTSCGSCMPAIKQMLQAQELVL